MIPTTLHTEAEHPFVSRGGLKMEAALHAFGFDPEGMTCADLGCSTGGFTSCLLAYGAAHVYSVDTAYGELAWKLRQDERVTVMERSNALHTPPHSSAAAGVDLVVLDLGWTKQDKAIPAAKKWLNPTGRIITLIKPHYEVPKPVSHAKKGKKKEVFTLTDEQAEAANEDVLNNVIPPLGFKVEGCIPCPIRGGKGGNLEYLALLSQVTA